MAYLKLDSIPAQQTAQAQAAVQIIANKNKTDLGKDSYESSRPLPFFGERDFGRG